jgi:hypothetical protein
MHPISNSDLAELAQMKVDAKRWRAVCDLLGLDPDRDPIHTLFEPKHTPKLSLPTGFDEEDDEAAKMERERTGRLAAERQVEELSRRLRLLQSQLNRPAPDGALAVRRPKRPDVIDTPALEVGVEANCPRPGQPALTERGGQ